VEDFAPLALADFLLADFLLAVFLLAAFLFVVFLLAVVADRTWVSLSEWPLTELFDWHLEAGEVLLRYVDPACTTENDDWSVVPSGKRINLRRKLFCQQLARLLRVAYTSSIATKRKGTHSGNLFRPKSGRNRRFMRVAV
jgi:polyferredoxin